jgi:hypothetical protein
MGELRLKLFVVLIGAILGGTASGVGTYFAQDTKYGVIIEKLSKESQLKEHKIWQLSDTVKELNSDLNNSKIKFNSLSKSNNLLIEEHQILEKEYARCISPSGLTITIGAIDTRSHDNSFKTGNHLEFKLTSSSLLISIIRVSEEGPVISVKGCENYITENEIKIEENINTYFIIKPGVPFIIRFTSQSCEDNENIDPNIVEEIILTVKDYDVDNQRFNLNYLRKFL